MAHPYVLGFAATYHAVQCRTLDKIILYVDRDVRPRIDYHAFYVGVSRTRSLDDIRVTDFKPIDDNPLVQPAWRTVVGGLRPPATMVAFFKALTGPTSTAPRIPPSPAPSPSHRIQSYSGHSSRQKQRSGGLVSNDSPTCKWNCGKAFPAAQALRQHELRCNLRADARPSAELQPTARPLFSEEPLDDSAAVGGESETVPALPWLENSQLDVILRHLLPTPPTTIEGEVLLSFVRRDCTARLVVPCPILVTTQSGTGPREGVHYVCLAKVDPDQRHLTLIDSKAAPLPAVDRLVAAMLGIGWLVTIENTGHQIDDWSCGFHAILETIRRTTWEAPGSTAEIANCAQMMHKCLEILQVYADDTTTPERIVSTSRQRCADVAIPSSTYLHTQSQQGNPSLVYQPHASQTLTSSGAFQLITLIIITDPSIV